MIRTSFELPFQKYNGFMYSISSNNVMYKCTVNNYLRLIRKNNNACEIDTSLKKGRVYFNFFNLLQGREYTVNIVTTFEENYKSSTRQIIVKTSKNH
jgi:hypothetical protein